MTNARREAESAAARDLTEYGSVVALNRLDAPDPVHSDACVGRIHDSLGCSCGVARVNGARVAYACRLPEGHDGDHHPNPCGHDGCTGLECLLPGGDDAKETSDA